MPTEKENAGRCVARLRRHGVAGEAMVWKNLMCQYHPDYAQPIPSLLNLLAAWLGTKGRNT
ncbi:MAG: hypothetical protein PHE53_08775 [Thermoguttaceae bacterium]|nr:hypothetical protein [Thermoguttaceae bacterium]